MKRIKMKDNDIFNLESHYYDFYRVKDRSGNKGTAFIFDKLTQNDVDVINKFKNTVISCGQYKYAPEIRNVRVIVLDKCKKNDWLHNK